MALRALEEHARRIDRDALRLFVLQRIQQEGILERLGVALTVRADGFQLSDRQRAGLREQPADDGALSMIDVTSHHDRHSFGGGRRDRAPVPAGDGGHRVM